MNKIYFIILGFFISIQLFAQVPIGQWTAHIPNQKALSLCEADNKIYCLTNTGIFYSNKDDNSIQKIGKIEGLSGINTRSINYFAGTKTVYIGYEDGTIDLIKNNNQITTLTDISRKSYASKCINKIQINDNLIYLSTDFGIVVFDPYKLEFKDTYIIGNNGYEIKVNALAFDNENIYAATKQGVKQAPLSSNQLPNYAVWSQVSYLPYANKEFNAIAIFNHKVVANLKQPWAYTYHIYVGDPLTQSYQELNPDSENYTMNLRVIDNRLWVIHKNHIGIYDNFSYPSEFYNKTTVSWGSISLVCNDAILDNANNMWYADESWTLVKGNYNNQNGQYKYPNGPTNNDSYYLDSKDNQTWVAAGALDISGANTFTPAAISKLSNNYWNTFNSKNVDSLSGIVDLISVEANPHNSNQIFCSSWNNGIIEMNFNGNKVTSSKIYNETNSTLKPFYGSLVKVWDCKVDDDNNLWVVNPGTNTPINVKTSDGKWTAFATPTYNSSWGNFIITNDGSKWFLLPRGNGIFVFNDYGIFDNTSNHFQKRIDVKDQNNEILSNDVFAIAQDKDDQIWVGTINGIVVYYSPHSIYNNDNSFYASKIIIDINGKNEYLMEGKKVTSIAVDGANRKWIGTNNSGVFLMSPDGTEQILTFNKDNSPLPSDKITSISIDNASGEVFIATGGGLMSYRSDATEGNDFFNDVYAFPNPVKPEYTGPITIKGLIENTTVKITDISGNLVTEMISLGGQAIWDGNTLNGNRAKTGIYLVFLSADNGESTQVTKILFIN